jgi:hypothetical protein
MVPRSLVSPPLGWDDLTYHLFKAGSWVQSAGFRASPGPDDWLRYDYFPASGEALWAWALLPARDGAYLGVASCAAWFGMLLSGFAACRALEVGDDRSVTAALAIASVPAAALAVEVSYVDNLQVVGFLSGVTFLSLCSRRFTWGLASLTLLGFWFAAGVKSSGVLFVVLGVAWVFYLAVRARGLTAAIGVAGLLIVVTSLVALPWYVRATAEQGSPLYPMPAPVLRDRLPFNQQQADFLEGRIFGEERQDQGFAGAIDAARLVESALRAEPLGVSWAPVPWFWFLGALAGAVYALLRWLAPGTTVFLMVVVFATVSELVSPRLAGQREYFPFSLGRLVLPLLAAVVLLTMRLPWGRWLPVPLLVVVAQLVATGSSLISSWSTVDTDAIRAATTRNWPAVLLVGGVVAAVFAGHRWPQYRFVLGALAVVLAASSLVVAADTVHRTRAERRHSFFEAASRGETNRFGKLGGHACAYPLWEAVTGKHATIAVTVGFGVSGHNLFRFPFLGPELENNVEYVPITADGTLIDKADHQPASVMDEIAWFQRLRERGIDYVAVLEPPPPESAIIERHSEIFEPVASSTCDSAAVYRVREPPEAK